MALTKEQWNEQLAVLTERQEQLLARPNSKKENFYNGIYDRYENPVLTAAHAPLIWRYDLCYDDNPNLQERLGVNAVLNSGAIYFDGKYCLVARVEGSNRKSFFALAESDKPTEGFRFRNYPFLLPDTCPEETDVYDMRITQHEDGWIYGVFCSESKDVSSSDPTAAILAAGIIRTKDLINWERLPNLVSGSAQQRNCCLHPEFVDGKYAFYTRPQDSLSRSGSSGSICFALCEDITRPVLCTEERVVSPRVHNTVTEIKNGEGAVPIKTPKGWIHIAHGVMNTTVGLRHVIYVFATDLNDPAKLIASPGSLFIVPHGKERAGGNSNICFTNGCIVKDENVYIYYSSSDTRVHVASTTIEKLMDYTFNTPEDPQRSVDCVLQRYKLIKKNIENGASSNNGVL